MKLRIIVRCDCFPVERLFSLEGWFKIQNADNIKRKHDGLFERENPCALCGHPVTFRLFDIVKS